MGNKKNIDRLFQEQFKNFEAIPSDAMWGNIQSELDGNKFSKKLIPLWLMFSGVAVILLFIGFSASLLMRGDNPEKLIGFPDEENIINHNKIVSDEIDKSNLLLVNQKFSQIVNLELNNDSLANIDVVDLNKVIIGSNSEFHKVLNMVVPTAEKAINTTKNFNDKRHNKIQFTNNHLLKTKIGFVDKSSSEKIAKNTKVPEVKEERFNVLKSVNSTDFNKNILFLNKSDLTANNKEVNKGKLVDFSDVLGVDSYAVTEKEEENSYINVKNADSVVTSDNIQSKELSGDVSANSSTNLSKESDASMGGEKAIVDSSIKNSSEGLNSADDIVLEEECVEEEAEKTIEEAIAELEENKDTEDEDEGEVVFNKWEITPNIAPVYYNTLSSGSPIDSELSGNKKKGKINISYGVGVGYAINKKLTLRTGIHKVSLGFDTEDVAININSEIVGGTRGMRNIDLSPAVASLNIASSESFSISQIPSSFSALYNSSLNQRLGYLEVPIELSYKVSDRKMKIDVIAGMSAFFLNENEIYTKTNGIETHIGEANNLNKMNYSTNIGLGFNYNISKTFNFNFEPTFKYQLNAFNNDSGNFKPYILGVYTGFSFKF